MIRQIPADYADVVPCPRCGARPGQPCDWAPFRSWLPHPERLDHTDHTDQSDRADQPDAVGDGVHVDLEDGPPA